MSNICLIFILTRTSVRSRMIIEGEISMVETLKNKYFYITIIFLLMLFFVGGLLTRNMEYNNCYKETTLSSM